MSKAPIVRTEEQLTALGLTLPETSAAPGWATTRALHFRKKMLCVFGDWKELPGHLTLIMKLPVSAGMVQDLYFVQGSKGWSRQHNWVIVRFGPDAHIMAEMETLKAWLVQSCCAVSPKKLAQQAAAGFRWEQWPQLNVLAFVP